MSEMKIEKLTDEQKNTLLDLTLPHGEGELALRIIDQLTAALDDMTKTASAGCARCLEREGDAHAKSEVTRLTAALESAEREHRRLQGMADFAGECEMESLEMYLAAESRAEALQARVAELEAEVAIAWDDDAETKRANAAEAELATTKVRVAELEALAGVSERQTRDMAFSERHLQTRLDAAESELATAKARVAELAQRTQEAERSERERFKLWLAADAELADLRGRVADARRKLTCPHRSDTTRIKDALEALRGR